ncbi:hypothetical protein P3W53_03500 [Pseudomonas denitrificans (nom. rej.)]|nr:hypothetical protein [Pseudomonas denitrificans (nom. rej.)]
MSEFNREDRYIVIKRKDLNAVPFAALQSFLEHLRALDSFLPRREFVVVESDWPEYETVWAMIAARVEGRPTPYQDLEQQVAALRQHKTDYMEAAEGTRKALEAEAQALREQNTKFQHMLADVVAKHFAENIKRSTEQKSMDVYLSEGIRLLEDEIAALRARVVVDEDAAFQNWFDREVSKIEQGAPFGSMAAMRFSKDVLRQGWEARALLNGKAVSEGLLRRFYEANVTPEDFDQLGALLGEGKEVSDVLVRE